MGALLSHGTSSVDGERIEQMGRPVLGCFGEAMIPVIQHRAQRVASCRQIGNLLTQAQVAELLRVDICGNFRRGPAVAGERIGVP